MKKNMSDRKAFLLISQEITPKSISIYQGENSIIANLISNAANRFGSNTKIRTCSGH
jgi:hypothetical protein